MPINRTLANYIASNPSTASTSRASGVWTLDEHGSALAQNTWPVPPNVVQRSLRFNGTDNTYLARTPSTAGNRKTWVWAAWVKVSATADFSFLFGTEYQTTSSYGAGIRFGSAANNNLDFYSVIAGGTINAQIVPTAYFRDFSAWHHILLAYDSTQSISNDRVKFFVNGTALISLSTASYPALNAETEINSTEPHFIGLERFNGSLQRPFNGYMTEVNFIDGYPTGVTNGTWASTNLAGLFGETDPQTGVWIPKPYVGTYGTNGFRLNFSNNSSTTALGYDSSGNGNNWTTNNFSITPGSGNDSLVDVPSLYGVDTGLGGEVRGNYATWNPLETITTSKPTNGNLDYAPSSTSPQVAFSSIAIPSTGKWYAEITKGDANTSWPVGIQGPTRSGITYASQTEGIAYWAGGQIYKDSALIRSGLVTATTNDVIGIAVDSDAKTVLFYKNGVVITTAISYTYSQVWFACGNYVSGLLFYANFGQRPWAYAPPTGYKALCTTNLSAPAVGQTSDNQADNYFQAVTYSGSGSSQSIPNIGFQPDLIWIKNRTLGASNTSYSNTVYDTVRGINTGGSPALFTDQTVGESTASGFGVTAIGNNNFTVVGNGSLTNATGSNYVAWCWNAGGTTVTNNAGSISSQVRANQMAGFSIVSYAGAQASTFTVGHGLNSTPAMIITKSRNATGEWGVYYTNEGINTNWMLLNSTAAKGINNGPLSGGAYVIIQPTNFQIAQTAFANSASEMIAYCWTAIPGYSSFGSYTANGITDGPFVYLGFRPKFIMIKKTSGTSNWILRDSVRGPTNVHESVLWSNLTLQEGGGFAGSNYSIDFLSNGFKIRNVGDDSNVTAGQTYIYMAFAEHPTRLATAR